MTNPEELLALCSRDQAEHLVRYDHHRVRVNDRLGIMLTYHWMPIEESVEPLILKVVFHDSAGKHPLAPPDVQQIINQLHFEHEKTVRKELDNG